MPVMSPSVMSPPRTRYRPLSQCDQGPKGSVFRTRGTRTMHPASYRAGKSLPHLVPARRQTLPVWCAPNPFVAPGSVFLTAGIVILPDLPIVAVLNIRNSGG